MLTLNVIWSRRLAFPKLFYRLDDLVHSELGLQLCSLASIVFRLSGQKFGDMLRVCAASRQYVCKVVSLSLGTLWRTSIFSTFFLDPDSNAALKLTKKA